LVRVFDKIIKIALKYSKLEDNTEEIQDLELQLRIISEMKSNMESMRRKYSLR